jgi:hypothetical protein
MPIRSSIDKQRRLILTTGEGCVTVNDISEHQDRLLGDPDFDAGFDQLIDFTAVSRLEVSAGEARILAERRVISPASRRAIVTTVPHVYGIGRMMEIFHEDLGLSEVELFHSLDEAFKWLEQEHPATH